MSKPAIYVWDQLGIWLGMSGFLLVATTLVAILEPVGQPRWLIASWAVIFAGWGLLVIGRMETKPHDHPRRVLLYFAGALVLFGWALTLHPVFYFFVAALYMQAYIFLELRWAIVVALGLTGVMIWSLYVGTGSTDFPFWTIAGMLLSTLLGIGLAVFIRAIIHQSLERQRLITELEAARGTLAQVERQAGVLQERSRLAGEIHDTLAQGFISIILHLEAADQQLPPANMGARPHIEQALLVGHEGLAEARRLVWALRPGPLEQAPLAEALQRVAQRWSEESAVGAQFNLTGTICQAHPHVEVTLLRVLQESLANVRKHAQAQMVRISLAYLEELITLDIQDDGCGFEVDGAGGVNQPAAALAGWQGGWGLTAMRTRLQTLGGSFVVESAPGHGTTVAVAVPLLITALEGSGS